MGIVQKRLMILFYIKIIHRKIAQLYKYFVTTKIYWLQHYYSYIKSYLYSICKLSTIHKCFSSSNVTKVSDMP